MEKFESTQYITKNNQSYTIRNISLDDAAALIDFYSVHAFDPLVSPMDKSEFKRSKEEEKKWIENCLFSDFEYALVAELNEQIIGVVKFEYNQVKRLSHVGGINICVHSEFRDLGVGTSLMNSLMEWARKLAYIERIKVSILATNHRAIHLFDKYKFKVDGLDRFYLRNSDGTYVNAILMSLWQNSLRVYDRHIEHF